MQILFEYAISLCIETIHQHPKYRIWLNLGQWFWRRWKYEKFTMTPTIDNEHIWLKKNHLGHRFGWAKNYLLTSNLSLFYWWQSLFSYLQPVFSWFPACSNKNYQLHTHLFLMLSPTRIPESSCLCSWYTKTTVFFFLSNSNYN